MNGWIALISCSLGVPTALSVFEDKPAVVTVDNFRRAETDTYFAKFAKDGCFGKLVHTRELAPIDKQSVIRMNRDTLYSNGVFDLDAAPVTVTLPDPGKRYQALQVVDEDHYAPNVVYGPGTHTLTKSEIGTRYVAFLVRTFVDPNDPADVKAANALQDGIRVEQTSAGKFEPPIWDTASLERMRTALLGVATANGGIDSARMFGKMGEVDPVQHLLGTAAGWGGNPLSAAMYSGASAERNDGKTAYRLTLKDVPVDAFWSVSVYDKDGFFEKNAKNAYTLNNVTAKPNPDGSVTIRFGGDESAPNCLPITPGWNYLVRFYRPRKELLDGKWRLPAAEEVK